MKILIVDDHALFRDGLRLVLVALEENANILEAYGHDDALRMISIHPDIDLVLLDLNMPGKDGFTLLDTLSRHYPALAVVILSASIQRGDVQRVLDGGAMGFIPKDTTSAVMLNAVRLILAGGVYVPQSMVLHIDPHLVERHSHGLSTRQLEVLTKVAQGYTNKEIAAQLVLAEATVKMHVTAIMKTLSVSNRTQAAMEANKLGLGLDDF